MTWMLQVLNHSRRQIDGVPASISTLPTGIDIVDIALPPKGVA
jgi:hypothetical protein